LRRFLVDENLPKDVRAWLENRGFDCVNVSETKLKGAKDHTLTDYASKNHMALVTLDRGFAKLYRTYPKGTLTVILIGAKPATTNAIIGILSASLPRIDLKKSDGKLVTISEKRIRITS
jgi:predicted nuclease of predicted toxin-antitoxin system